MYFENMEVFADFEGSQLMVEIYFTSFSKT